MIYRLSGYIQHYDWGGSDFIAEKLQLQNPERLPFAEYWLGVHPGGATAVDLGNKAHTTLASLVASDKLKYLGQSVVDRFNGLPYLLKVLDVKDMLSIQVHPSIDRAIAGFARENEKQISLNAPERSFRDQNHKPEVMVALSEFWLLHGFAADISARLQAFSFLHPFQESYSTGGLPSLFTAVMSNAFPAANQRLLGHLDEIIPLYTAGKLDKQSPDFWSARAFQTFCKNGQIDTGLFCIYLMNLVHLKPGEGIYQPSGILHAYLEGQNIELMSNSDNVLRAGLTTKYINTEALIQNTRFVETIPQLLTKSINKTDVVLHFPVDDFSLRTLELGHNSSHSMESEFPSIALLLSGNARWSSEGSGTIPTTGLSAMFIPAHTDWQIEVDQSTQLFIASLPS